MIRILLILLAFTTAALAQAASPQPQSTPLEQSLSQKLLEEINSNIQLRSQLITAQERIKQLEAAKPKEPNKK